MFDGFSTWSPLDAFFFLGYGYKFLDTGAHVTLPRKEQRGWEKCVYSNNNNKKP